MRHSNRFLCTVMALGVFGALALGPVSQAGEARKPAASATAKAQPGVKRPGNRVPTESFSFNFEKVEPAFNPKEFTIDPSVPQRK
jgi:hypothetical protein